MLWSFEQLTIGNADEAAETFAKRVTTQPREMAALVSFDPAALSARVRVSRAPTARTRGIPSGRRAMCAPTRANSRHDGRSDAPVYEYTQLSLETKLGISLHDITPQVRAAIRESGMSNGTVNVLSRHTTTAVTINEAEDRLMDDIRQYMLKLAPPGDPYLHNDIHLRDGPPDWPGGNDAWRAQEPKNAHSHLLSMLIGNSLAVPVVNGELAIGTWQSLMLVELDGPRTRTVGVQVCGNKGSTSRKKVDTSESSSNAASKTYQPKEKASVSDGYKDPMDELCEEDPSADECKVFD